MKTERDHTTMPLAPRGETMPPTSLTEAVQQIAEVKRVITDLRHTKHPSAASVFAALASIEETLGMAGAELPPLPTTQISGGSR